MWIGESGRKAYHGQCDCSCQKSGRTSYIESKVSASLIAELNQKEEEERIKLIEAQLGIKE